MKRILFAAFCLILGHILYSQTYELDRLYNTYRGEEDVISVFIPGFACRLAASIGEMETQEQELLRSIKSLRIQVIENKEINRTVNYVHAYAGMKQGGGYFPMLEVHDKGEDVLILARQKEEIIRELVILVGGEENVMIWVKGRMDQDLMKNLFKVTGIEQSRYTKEI
jgi:hypothetical protein